MVLLVVMGLILVFNGNCNGPCGSRLVIGHLLFGGLLKPINPNSLDRIYPQKSGLKLMGYNVCSGNHYNFL